MVSCSHWGLFDYPLDDDGEHYELPAPGDFIQYGIMKVPIGAVLSIVLPKI